MKPKESPQAAACKTLPPALFDAVNYIDAQLGLEACASCTVRTECLMLVDPMRNYFDGIAGGYVWRDGKLQQWSVKLDTAPLDAYLATVPKAHNVDYDVDLNQQQITF